MPVRQHGHCVNSILWFSRGRMCVYACVRKQIANCGPNRTTPRRRMDTQFRNFCFGSSPAVKIRRSKYWATRIQKFLNCVSTQRRGVVRFGPQLAICINSVSACTSAASSPLFIVPTARGVRGLFARVTKPGWGYIGDTRAATGRDLSPPPTGGRFTFYFPQK